MTEKNAQLWWCFIFSNTFSIVQGHFNVKVKPLLTISKYKCSLQLEHFGSFEILNQTIAYIITSSFLQLGNATVKHVHTVSSFLIYTYVKKAHGGKVILPSRNFMKNTTKYIITMRFLYHRSQFLSRLSEKKV